MKVKEESEKVGLELNIQKMRLTVSSSITPWLIDGEKVEAVTDFIYLAAKSPWMVTAVTIVNYVAPWKKTVTNLNIILKSRDITLAPKFRIVKAMAFPVVMYGCDSWTMQKAEHWRTDAFKLLCWRVPWAARRSNHSILKETNPEYLLEGQIWNWISYTLTTWCEEMTHWKRPWHWERLRAGGEGDNRGWDG